MRPRSAGHNKRMIVVGVVGPDCWRGFNDPGRRFGSQHERLSLLGVARPDCWAGFNDLGPRFGRHHEKITVVGTNEAGGHRIQRLSSF